MFRYLRNSILKDLEKSKMVFLAGPRQVGKTTLSLNLSDNFQYYNWDFPEDRRLILDYKFNPDKELVVFDEIHKYGDFKNYLKGLYDKKKDKFKIIVTGSSRLDVYRKGGDSLLGRYFLYRLYPFSVAELRQKSDSGFQLKFEDFSSELRVIYEDLWLFGGFPESYLAKDVEFTKRWGLQRVDRTVKEDIRDLNDIKDLSLMQILVDLIPARVGGRLSLNSLRESLDVSHYTVSSWVQILEDFYYLFRLKPFVYNIEKSLKKDGKVYLWDWSVLKDEGSKFENLIAVHLHKWISYMVDVKGDKYGLFYVQDKESREVDFVITVDGKPEMLIETKLSDTKISKNLLYFKEKLGVNKVYQVLHISDIDFYDEKTGVRVISADKFLTAFV